MVSPARTSALSATAVLLAGVVVVAVSGVPIGTFATSAGAAQNLLADSFDRADSDVVGPGWAQTGTATAIARIRTGELRMNTRDDLAAPVVSRTFAPVTSGLLSWSYAMDWSKVGAESSYEVRMQLIDSAAAAAPSIDARSGAVVDLRWGGVRPGVADQVLAAYGPAGALLPVAAVRGRVRVDVVADLDTDSARVTVTSPTGPLGAATVPLAAAAGIDGVRLFTSGLNDRNFTGLAFDDIRVDAGATPPVATTAPTTIPATVPSSSPTSPTASPTPYSGLLLADSFDRPPAAALGPPWAETEDSANQVRVSGTAMSFTSRDGVDLPVARAMFPRQTTGILRLDYLLDWQRTATENTFGVVMRLADGAASGDVAPAVELVWGGVAPLGLGTDRGFGYRVAGVTTQVGVVTGPTRVRVLADLDAGTFSLDLNPGTGPVEASGIRLGTSGVGAVEFRTTGVNTTKFSTAGFDDVVVSVQGGSLSGPPPPTPTTTAPVSTTPVSTTPVTTSASSTSPAPPLDNVLSVSGNRLLNNGAPIEVTGIRLASAPLSGPLTDQLIALLPVYKAYEVNAVAIYYMGSTGGASDPFASDGRSVDPTVQGRIDRIIAAADSLGMVVVVGIYYQGATLKATTADGVRNVVRTVARELRGEKNVIINLVNEQNSNGYSDMAGYYDVRVPELVLQLCDVYQAVDRDMIVGVGGYDPAKNDIMAADPRCDVLTANNGDSGERYDRYVAAGLTKPMINVEILGGRSQPVKGEFGAGEQAVYTENIVDAAARPGLAGVFFHNKQWTQQSPYRYDLGGSGAPGDPGIRWWFEFAEQVHG